MRVSAAIVATLAVVSFMLGAGPCPAEESEAVSIHGFGGWAAGYTSNDNDFNDTASNDLAVENYYFTLNVFARPFEKATIHAQPTWESNLLGKEAKLDLVYLEWTFLPETRVRAGKIRNPLGIYTEIFKVGTLRPFYLLPNAMYRNGPESYTGVGLNRVQKLGTWELEFDLVGGQMDFMPMVTDMKVGMNPKTGQPIFASVNSQREGRDLFGGGLLVRPPVQGLEVSIAGYGTEIWAGPLEGPVTDVSTKRTNALTGGLEYTTTKLSLRAEGLGVWGDMAFKTGYVEAAYMLTDHWQVAAQYDVQRRNDPPAIQKQLADHSAIGAALNYWINSNVVWKANYYHVTDNYLARPEDAVNKALAGQLERKTDVFVLGLHFSF
jgi:hypothetical protein